LIKTRDFSQIRYDPKEKVSGHKHKNKF